MFCIFDFEHIHLTLIYYKINFHLKKKRRKKSLPNQVCMIDIQKQMNMFALELYLVAVHTTVYSLGCCLCHLGFDV